MNDKLLFCGENAVVHELSKIVYPDHLFLDDFSVISDFTFILATKFVKIGKYSQLSPYSLITGGGEVYIGNFVDISYGAKIICGSDDIFGEFLFTSGVPKAYRNIIRNNVEINDYSIIGANSIIYPGVTVGEGVIVNPSTIVKENLKPWSVYEGVNCKLIGKRKFKKEIVSKAENLLTSKLV